MTTIYHSGHPRHKEIIPYIVCIITALYNKIDEQGCFECRKQPKGKDCHECDRMKDRTTYVFIEEFCVLLELVSSREAGVTIIEVFEKYIADRKYNPGQLKIRMCVDVAKYLSQKEGGSSREIEQTRVVMEKRLRVFERRYVVKGSC
jgi:hypothetical protein